MKVSGLKCEAMKNPLGISVLAPRLSWIISAEERGVMQTACRIIVRKDDPEQGEIIYDSGERRTQENSIVPADVTLESAVRYYWNVTVADNMGRSARAEAGAWFEMGLLKEEDWKARWIEPEQIKVIRDIRPPQTGIEPKQDMQVREERMNPSQMLRKEFTVRGKVLRARAYATAHGIYRLMFNGKRAGEYELAPEVTPYHTMLQVQTYDITELLREGENAVGAVLANGWWAGRIGHYGESCQYGDTLALLLQIRIEYEDGTEEIIGSDESFYSSEGPWRYAEIGIGEKYDRNYEKEGWMLPGYDGSGWRPAVVQEYGFGNLTGQNAPHIQVLETIEDPEEYLSPKGEKILDFGQAMAGNAVIALKGEPGAAVTLKYFETTDKDGNYWFELEGQNSQQTDVFVLDESGEGVYDPWFTYHGFRYIWISSDKGDVEVRSARARLIASAADVTAGIHTSSEKVNRLQENIKWTLRSNMTSVLTDNPDRERAGWTGDLQMIAPTLFYNVDALAFTKRWLREAALEQRANGSIPLVVPNWPHYEQMPMETSAGWGDVSVIVPWLLYERYGDASVLGECWEMMEKWMSYMRERAEHHNPPDIGEITEERKERLKYLWNADFNFGDWLTPSACYNEETGEYSYYTQTLCYMMGSYYYAYSASIMEKAAAVLGLSDKEREYGDLAEKIRQAAIEEIYKTGGILESEYMGAQILALHMGFCPEEEKQKLVDRVVELFKERGLDTGFSSALLISDTLCENGYPEMAYDILLNEEFPSWLYEVNQGATTVWESMQAAMPDGTRNAVSFIQPALCSIGNWMVQGMGGIRPEEPGFRRIGIRPYFTERLTSVEAEYMSAQGRISTAWERADGKIRVKAEIPANTTAVVTLPYAAAGNVKESGRPIAAAEGILGVIEEDGRVKVEISSGSYLFEATVHTDA